MVAALAAFSYAGFNLSSLAIIAGALSLGIGFGLQNLVNNFVSGLILLAERPIKVGDLVVVGGEEGYVRKISVRSTELETFDRASVLIPNSSFISDKVKNWTFRNNICRIAIPLGVAYGSDPRQVRDVLLTIARPIRRCLRHRSLRSRSMNSRLPICVLPFTHSSATSRKAEKFAPIWRWRLSRLSPKRASPSPAGKRKSGFAGWTGCAR
jgi:small-conductance mechanosensitive channel